jgi:hypothetical protein
MPSKHASASVAQVAVKSQPSVLVAPAKKAARSTPVAKSTKVQVVTPRRLARDFAAGKKGEIVLIIDPNIYGSTGDNWLNGRSYGTKELALAAAAKAGAQVAS